MKRFLDDYRFIWHWKWLTALLTLIAIGATCVWLALWQLGRYERAEAHADIVTRNYAAAAVPFTREVPTLNSTLTDNQMYRPVTLTGRYLTGETMLARNRPLDSRSGFYVVVPFRTATGTLLVNRGWIASNARGEAPATIPSPANGEITLHARLEVPEETLVGRTNPPGQVQSINVPVLAGQEFRELKPFYTGVFVEMISESTPASVTPSQLPQPSIDLGPHLGYAWQWYVFAAFFPLGWFVQARREAANRREVIAASAAASGTGSATGSASGSRAPEPKSRDDLQVVRSLRVRDHFSARNVAGEDEFAEDEVLDEQAIEGYRFDQIDQTSPARPTAAIESARRN